MQLPSGLVLLDKPSGITSFQAIAAVKRRLGHDQVGHAGTLDRYATGLLLVLCGPLTRLARLLADLDKSYHAWFTFGRSTDTLDPEGKVVAEADIPSRERIERAASRCTGAVEQVPPAYSALHVHGRRAYRLARAGETPALRPRSVLIHRISILRYDPPELELAIDCSKGTYIRALARDMGTEAGSCAYVTGLRRTRVGGFRVEEAVAPDKFSPEHDLLPAKVLVSRLEQIRAVEIREELRENILNGLPIGGGNTAFERDGLYALFDDQDRLVAVMERKKDKNAYLAVFREGCR